MGSVRRWRWAVAGAGLFSLWGMKGHAADTIILSFGGLELPVAVADLETYIKTGQVPSQFQPLVAQAPPQELERLVTTLKQPLPVNADTVARIFGTSTGQVLLSQLGQVVQTAQGENGATALQTALVQAAKQPGGVTFLRVIQAFPGTTMRLNLVRGLAVMNQVNRYIAQVNGVFAVLTQEFHHQARQKLPANLPNLTQPGPFLWQVQELTLTDSTRQRTLPVTVYLPNRQHAPTVLISHGLGESRQNFAYLAEHLASYGLGVILPEHPGSDAQKLQRVLAGKEPEYIVPEELVHRPLDVTLALNTLAAQPPFAQALHLKQVAALGHSYGGYTALAVAGARLNLAHLTQVCTDAWQGVSLNLSLLLQCPGRRLQNPPVQFRDERVVAVMAVNPVGSALFGASGLAQVKIPTFFVTATQDIAAPSLYEQIRPFTWLGSAQRYLAVMEGASHFAIVGGSTGGIPLPADVVGPAPEVAQMYLKVLALAFSQVYVAKQAEFAPFLTAAYARQLSRSVLPLQVLYNPPLAPITQALAD
ncbi:alpha/beta hydrolase [Gloeomargarita sp.]